MRTVIPLTRLPPRRSWFQSARPNDPPACPAWGRGRFSPTYACSRQHLTAVRWRYQHFWNYFFPVLPQDPNARINAAPLLCGIIWGRAYPSVILASVRNLIRTSGSAAEACSFDLFVSSVRRGVFLAGWAHSAATRSFLPSSLRISLSSSSVVITLPKNMSIVLRDA